ncbi:hypothetical protein LTR01_005151 [Friedmanniomyces endolithicus]|nr:hypothetical protein LTR01_005151 [Friedmanniomyces endolithicus]
MPKHTVAVAKQAIRHHVKPNSTGAAAAATGPHKPPRQQQYLRFIYDANPRPINITTLTSTKDFANDPSHPFHIRTHRSLQAFDPKKLHWRVQCPMDVSRRAFRLGASDGKQEESGGGGDERENRNEEKSTIGTSRADADHARPNALGLSGALVVLLPKDGKLALTATKEQVEASARWVLEEVARLQAEARRRGSYKPRLGR